jgi:two-component system phosphate regulon sensor histidine kinase PhoR
MQKPYRIVFLLMVAFIIIVNLLQVYWLINSIRIADKQYIQTLDNCLSNANYRYSDLKIKELLPKAGKLAKVYIIGAVQDGAPASLNLTRTPGGIIVKSKPNDILIDTLSSYYAHAFWADVSQEKSFDFALFNRLFKLQLSQNNISADYKLDTAFNKGDLSGVIDLMKTHTYKEYPLQTWGITVGTFGRIMVWASFVRFPPSRLYRLSSILIANVLILAAANIILFFILRTIKKQKQLSELKADFINNMTHELKTPVSVIATAVDAILEHKIINNKDKVLAYLSFVKEEVSELNHLINRVLEVSIEKENFDLEIENVDLPEMIGNVLKKFSINIEKAVRFHFEQATSHDMIKADPLLLRNMLNNLIDNSIKYSGDQVNISIKYAIDGDRVLLTIRDDGIGIEPKFHKDIFDKFFRVPTGNLYNIKGTGLGLSYVKSIIEQHNGKIIMQSTPGAGTEFFINLPI